MTERDADEGRLSAGLEPNAVLRIQARPQFVALHLIHRRMTVIWGCGNDPTRSNSTAHNSSEFTPCAELEKLVDGPAHASRLQVGGYQGLAQGEEGRIISSIVLSAESRLTDWRPAGVLVGSAGHID